MDFPSHGLQSRLTSNGWGSIYRDIGRNMRGRFHAYRRSRSEISRRCYKGCFRCVALFTGNYCAWKCVTVVSNTCCKHDRCMVITTNLINAPSRSVTYTHMHIYHSELKQIYFGIRLPKFVSSSISVPASPLEARKYIVQDGNAK
jgi:hypothetical protein